MNHRDHLRVLPGKQTAGGVEDRDAAWVYGAAATDREFFRVPLWKRVLDVTCIILALPFLVPLMLLLALMIKCVSKGPVLFLQERVGHLGRRFICFKFRTMKVDADVDIHRRHLDELMRTDSPMVKMDHKGDPRLIPMGSILRATGIDELPQLLNVIGGQMSLVGPRPCVPYEYENYLPEQKRRFETLPGLTGLWQVSGKNNTTFSQMIHLDIHYAETKSLGLDIRIIFKTVPALVRQVREGRRNLRVGRRTAGKEIATRRSDGETQPRGGLIPQK